MHFDKPLLSFIEGLRASLSLYETTNYPFLLSLSKHEWIIFRGSMGVMSAPGAKAFGPAGKMSAEWPIAWRLREFGLGVLQDDALVAKERSELSQKRFLGANLPLFAQLYQALRALGLVFDEDRAMAATERRERLLKSFCP